MAVSSDDFLTYETRLPNVEIQNYIVDNIDILEKKLTILSYSLIKDDEYAEKGNLAIPF